MEDTVADIGVANFGSLGDITTGDGDGDDETIHLFWNAIPIHIERLVVVVNIFWWIE